MSNSYEDRGKQCRDHTDREDGPNPTVKVLSLATPWTRLRTCCTWSSILPWPSPAMRTPHHLLGGSIPKRAGHGQSLPVLATLIIPLVVVAILDPEIAQAAVRVIAPGWDEKWHWLHAAEGAAALVPISGSVVFDVHDVPARHRGQGGVAEGTVVHVSDLDRVCCRGPGEPEDTLDLGGGKGGDGEEVFDLGLGRGGNGFR